MSRTTEADRLRKRARKRIDYLFRVGEGKCHWCGCELSLDLRQDKIPYATIDHVYPIGLGGDSNPTNVVISCGECNKWRNIAWQSYGLLLYASKRIIQRELEGKKKVSGAKMACRASKQYVSAYQARGKMVAKIRKDNIPEAIASQFKVYRCEFCGFYHWRKFLC